MKWLVANKRKTGRLNYSKVITFRTPAGRGRKGERLPRNRRGKQTTSMMVSRNPLPSAPSIGANECENYPDVAQLHKLFYASCQPSVASHQAQLSQLYPAVYNPPGFPFHGGSFHHPYASTFQVHTTSSFPSGTPSSVLVYSTRTLGRSRSVALGIVAAFLLPRGLAEKYEKMVAATKFRQPPHNIVVKYFHRRVVERWCTAQTLPTFITIPVLYIS